jgi:hypothetical protein
MYQMAILVLVAITLLDTVWEDQMNGTNGCQWLADRLIEFESILSSILNSKFGIERYSVVMKRVDHALCLNL